MNKLPKIFKNNITKDHINNKEVVSVKEKSINNNLTVEEKIKKLFKSSKYIFNISVYIKTKKKDYDTKIIGRIKNSLITEDNEVIPIIEIEDIIIRQ